MKHLCKPSLLLALAAGLAAGQTNHPAFTRSSVTFTPSNLFTPQSTVASLPLVSGMDFFPDGRIALLEWGVPGSVFIISANVATTTSGVGITRFARGMNSAMGLKVVNNSIYVMEKEGLTQLVDTDNDGVADEYNSINQGFPSNNSMLNLAYDLGYMGGNFYAAVSSDVAVGGYDYGSSRISGSALAGRSTMYQMRPDGSSTAYACGFRNPNGMEVNGEDIFVSDNEGSWMPTSKLIHVKQGRFYGHRTNPVNACQSENSNKESPPVVWGTYDDANATGRSWGSPALIRSGPYKGQFLMGETVMNAANNVVRVFVEKVEGELQGAILPFIPSGNSKGVQRIVERNGTIFLGIHGSSGGWGARSGMVPGFDVLKPNASTNFLEVMAVRSKGSSSFELEFNKSVGSGAASAGQYSVSTWQNISEETYGGGRYANKTNLSVSSASVSTDKRKVTLNISGLKTGWVVKFVFGSGISGEDASNLHTGFAVYTLNKFGPGTDYETVPVGVATHRGIVETGWQVVSGNGYHLLQFAGNSSVPRDVTLHDIKGVKRRELRGISDSEVRLETGNLAKGMYLVRVTERGKTTLRHLLVP